MTQKVLCCGILEKELEFILQGKDVEIHYLDPALHVNLDKLEVAVSNSLDNLNNNDIPLVMGYQCHPELPEIVSRHGGRLIQSKNCIELLLGEKKMAELDAQSRNFYISNGWLENWKKIFIESLMWSEIDARQNFGYYDRILLLDTGITPIDDKTIIEFFDYSQVPIETIPVELNNFRMQLERLFNNLYLSHNIKE